MNDSKCRVHPDRKGTTWVCGDGTQLCDFCYSAFKRECPNSGGDDYRKHVLGWIQQQTSILCPGCAHDFAILEDAQREVEAFLKLTIPDESVRVGFE